MDTQPDYKALFHASPYPHLLLDKALTIIDANNAYLKATGTTRQQLIGQWVFDAFPENPADPSSSNIKQVKSSMERAIETGQPDTTPILRYAVPVAGDDGDAFEARYWSAVHTPVFGPDGEVAFVIQNALDVTHLYRLSQDSQRAIASSPASESFSQDSFSRAQMHEAMMRVLKDERSHLRNLFNQSPGFVAVTMGPTHVFEMVNDAYYQLVGQRELLGKPAFEALPELLGQGFKELIDGVYQTGQPWVGQGIKGRVRPTEGGPMVERYIDLVYQPFHDADGKVIGVFTQGHDVTDACKTRAAEREVEERWKLALEASGGGVWVWDLPNDKVEISRTWKAMLGYGDTGVEESFDGWKRLVHPDDLPETLAVLERHATGETEQYSAQYRMRHKNGSWVWILGRGAVVDRDADGKPLRMIGTNTDVSHIKRIEEELCIERDRSQAVFDTMTEGFAMLGSDWTMLYMNVEGLRIANRHGEQIIGQNHWELWPETVGSDLECMYRRVMQTRQPETLEFEHAYLDGTIIWLEVRAYAGIDGGLSIFFRDVTTRKEAEERLKDADQRKDEFLAMLAHELRNPLAPIGAAAELLQLVKLDEERVKKTSEVIGRQVSHMTGLIDDLLDVSRVTRGLIELDKATLDIQHVVADAVEQVRPLIHARGHELTIQLAPQTALVEGDKKRLVQALANVLNNAAKYTAQGGHIILCASVQDSDVLIMIADDGIGMKPETAQHAFDLFAQAERTSDRSSGGLGLGLALVKSLVDLHGGSVTCKSDGLGQGSAFSIRLPRLLEPVHSASCPHGESIHQPAGADSLLILVVDDNVDAAEMLKLLLEAKGHKVLVEHRPYQALERAKLCKPQVCLIDIGLPEIDGNELARRLRAQSENASTVLVAVTGYGQESDRASSLAAGFEHYLVKPVDIAALTLLLSAISKS
jgi:PAS domain S-box-containing protein